MADGLALAAHIAIAALAARCCVEKKGETVTHVLTIAPTLKVAMGGVVNGAG